MVNTNKPEQQQPRQEQAKVAVTNTYRHRPIAFSVIGGSVRLGPLETCELDRDCLALPELSQLILSGIVQVRELGAPVAAPADKVEGEVGSEKKGGAGGFYPGSAQESKVENREK
jgi:hypothetical protein